MPAFFMEYIEIHISDLDASKKELVFAFLPEFGFCQFEEQENDVKAYATRDEAKLDELKQWFKHQSLSFQESTIKETNWNSAWESNFQPVEIPKQVYIRADFHPSKPGYEHEIIITPKMSFGTGHHATTKMMMSAMLELDFKHKKVLDFGTGTGILSILAEKLGAVEILAIDNDQWSFENAIENISLNEMYNIKVECKNHLKELPSFDIILANINKNILIEHAEQLQSILNKKGTIVISGLLSVDYDEIARVYQKYFGPIVKHYSENGWIALSFKL